MAETPWVSNWTKACDALGLIRVPSLANNRTASSRGAADDLRLSSPVLEVRPQFGAGQPMCDEARV